MLLAHRHQWVWGLFFCWLVFSALAFWWFQFRYIGAFDDYWATFNGSAFNEIKVKPHNATVLVVHFVEPKCPCSRFSVSHIQRLEAEFKGEVEFVDLLTMPDSDPRKAILNSISIPAGPSVAVWDSDGELAYFGPYSGGSFCGQGTDFVSLTLNALAEQQNPRWINQEAVGCYCAWHNAEK